MDSSDALPFIEALASGHDPLTGEPLPEDSPLHHPQVIRALFTAIRLIELQSNSASAAPTPKRAGESWEEGEDQRLVRAFHAGKPFSQMAETHQRSRGAIVSRLVRLGCIQKGRASIDDEKPSWKKDRPQAGRTWTPEEDAHLRILFAKGLRTEELARHLGRGQHAVDVRLCKLGLASMRPIESQNPSL